MANIFTSYLRILSSDRQPLTEDEINFLFSEIVQSYGEFGSYWVRIEKNYNFAENYLDITFGSRKIFHTGNYILERPETVSKYYVWERLADEGGANDALGLYEYNSAKQWVERLGTDCLYGFDKIRITGTMPALFPEIGEQIKIGDATEILVNGSYRACNSRSFVDLVENTEYYGACLQYDPAYQSDAFIEISLFETSIPALNDYLAQHFQTSSPGYAIEFEWKGRIVKRISDEKNDFNKPLILSADAWDNVLNQPYINFLKEYQAK